MLTLTLKLKDKTIREYRFQKGKTITIGRRSDNDVVIDNLGVSGCHAKIELQNEGVLLTDLESTNGSLVNEKTVSSQKLKKGDVITIGKHTLIFSFDEERFRSEDKVWGMDETVVMDTESCRSMLAGTPTDLPPKKHDESLGTLSFLDGGKGEIILSKKFIKIGKNASSDILARGFLVSQTAATISKRVNGYYLSNAGGIIKPKVNGKKIDDSIRLNELDIIKIGSAKMQFNLKSTSKLDFIPITPLK